MNFSQLSFGFFAIKLYGTILSIAFMISAWHYYKSLKKKQLPIDFFLHHFWRWLMGAFFGGRIIALILEPTIFVRNGLFSFFAFWDGEFHSLGMLIGFSFVLWWDMKKSGKSFFKWTDVGILPMILGLMIADLGGFFTGAIYGKETILPWGVQYETFGVDVLTPVHPVTIYAFFIHLWMWWWFKKRENTWERFTGRLTVRAIMFLFLSDFVLQFFRGDETIIIFQVFRVEQVLDVLLLSILFWWNKKRVMSDT
ncbi:prolipoprotein diacylglyceryl transferase [Candidatus Gracilibacteria bacterium]|nr:prolipoprotein diacylglyceryl transferase [Candidatus Gracilibacteria bacterium]